MLVKVKDVKAIMEKYFPPYLAEDWDNVGLQLGSMNKDVTKVIVALDLDEEVLKQALNQKADMIITHHPFIFKPLKRINYDLSQGRLIRDLIQTDITVYSAHTNLDAGEKGLNQVLAEMLGLENIKPLDHSHIEDLYKLVVFVPASHVNKVREAINNAGAGDIGKYSDCSFRTSGTGTFRPGEDTDPFIGEQGLLEEVDEFRLETAAYQRDLDKVVQAMIKAHPYEEVAYDIYRLENQGRIFSLGRKGNLDSAVTLEEYAREVKKQLGIESVRVTGDLTRKVKKVAVVSGAGASFIGRAKAQKIDVLVTGDVKYHEARDAEAQGVAVIDAGHQGTEEIIVPYLCNLLKKECSFSDIEIKFIPAYSEPCFKNI